MSPVPTAQFTAAASSSLTNGHHVEKQPVHGFGTKAIHAGSPPDSTTGAVIPAISLSTTYKQSGIGIHSGFEYSRSGNPNRNAFETTLASLESGGAHALAFSSGSAATAVMIQSLPRGSHILSVNDVYGGTRRYMTQVGSGLYASGNADGGVETSFEDLESLSDDEIYNSIRPNTKLIWIESPTNPTLRVISIPRISRLAHSHPSKPLVLVDNTFLSPFYSSPLEQGADVVLHSLTKYVGGHSDVVIGALILPADHTELEGKLRYFQNAIGAVPSPFDCWLAQRGTKTLHLRMKAHGQNALAIAHHLEKSPYVEQVVYPGLPSHPRHERAWKSLSPHAKKWIGTDATVPPAGGFPYGGIVSFRIRGASSSLFQVANKFLTSTRLFTLAESLGGVESLAEHPAGMTHASVPVEERAKLGISDGLIRLSVGVEETEDLIADLDQALREACE
ncbi:pyridoxal phosphate-dependent transferase [Mycena floridula]|nr:pyridoxal phosphate-dependent transferase [Mycena floridula]